MIRQLRSDLQARLGRFFDDVGRSRATAGDAAAAVGTTVGPFRSSNEDRAAVARVHFPNNERSGLQIAIVCDGMGGLIDGGAAASIAAASFLSVIATLDLPLESVLSKAVREADANVYARLGGRGGTTLTAVVTDGAEAWCAHVGDSRLYVSGTDGLNLLSHDDTIQGAVHAHEGQAANEDDLDNRLLQFVGIGEALAPHIFRVPIQEDDLWVVTSDGAHGIGRKTLESLLETNRSALDVARRMVFVADALNVRDNASITVLRQTHMLERSPPYAMTTLLISSPVHSLEIWLADAGAVPATEPLVRPAAEEPLGRQASATEGKASSSIGRRSRQRPRKKQALEKPSTKAPLEILFEAGKEDD